VLPAQDLSIAARAEFYASRYLVLRAGHTRDLCIPLRNVAVYLTAKKDRKFVVASPNAVEALAFAKRVYNYRPPSAYTGRGVRVKHAKPARKAGKKDKQRGRAF
jgi:ribosomal protein L6P/L9E